MGPRRIRPKGDGRRSSSPASLSSVRLYVTGDRVRDVADSDVLSAANVGMPVYTPYRHNVPTTE